MKDQYRWNNLMDSMDTMQFSRDEILIDFQRETPEEVIRFFSGALHLSIMTPDREVKYKNPLIMIDKKISKDRLLLKISSLAGIRDGDIVEIYAVQQRVRKRAYEVKKREAEP